MHKVILKSTLISLVLIMQTTVFISCDSDEVGENLYTFTGKMMGQYLASDTVYSEFLKLTQLTKVDGLLNSYGLYTCFVPTNSALREFYAQKGKKKLEEFTPDSLKQMVYDHLINGHIFMHNEFPRNGSLPNITMSDRYVMVTVSDDGTFINKNSQVLEKDIVVHNGVLHKINKVLDPVRSGIVELISKNPDFSLFYEALVATGLADSLLKTVDKEYFISQATATDLENAVQTTVSSERYAPRTRKFGYTVFMESNLTLAKYNINNLSTLKEYAASVYDQIYPQDANVNEITDRRNSLNRFIAYHLINKQLIKSRLITDYDTNHQWKTIDMYEFIETMCPNSLIEVKIKRSSGQTNLINTLSETGEYISLTANTDNLAVNGVYHEIDKPLVYSADVEAELSSKRLRFDMASMFPELTNNNMRGRPSDNSNNLYRNALPPKYLDRFECTEQTVLCYSNAHDKLMNYMGDEFFIVVQGGKLYDFVITTPPIPAETYEVRFGYQSNGRRGVAQFYVDGVPCGVPVNLNTLGTDIGIGYVLPGNDPDDTQGFLNDKMMRNLGYMKGPHSFKAINESWYAGQSARYNSSNLRKILGTYRFTEPGHHKLMVKGLSGGQFQIDFIEFVPTSLIESEDIY